MKELINFIPKTVSECRRLLDDLRAHRDGVSVPDRYGFIGDLTKDEATTLIDLVSNQIGEKKEMFHNVPQLKKGSKKAPVKK